MKEQYKKWMDEVVDKQNFCIWMAAHDLEELLTKAYELAKDEDNWKNIMDEPPTHNGRFMVLVQGEDLPPYVDFAEYNGSKWQIKLDGQYKITHYQKMPGYQHLCLPKKQ